jgi:hypothetical protein
MLPIQHIEMIGIIVVMMMMQSALTLVTSATTKCVVLLSPTNATNSHFHYNNATISYDDAILTCSMHGTCVAMANASSSQTVTTGSVASSEQVPYLVGVCQCNNGWAGDLCDQLQRTTAYMVLCGICLVAEVALTIVAIRRMMFLLKSRSLLVRTNHYMMGHHQSHHLNQVQVINPPSPPMVPLPTGDSFHHAPPSRHVSTMQLATLSAPQPLHIAAVSPSGAAITPTTPNSAMVAWPATSATNSTNNNNHNNNLLLNSNAVAAAAAASAVLSFHAPHTSRMNAATNPTAIRVRLRWLYAQILALAMALISCIAGGVWILDPLSLNGVLSLTSSSIMYLIVKLFVGLACGLTLRIFISIQAIFHTPSRRVLHLTHLLLPVYTIIYIIYLIMVIMYGSSSSNSMASAFRSACSLISFIFMIFLTIGWGIYTMAIARSVAAGAQRSNAQFSEQQANAVALVQVSISSPVSV